METAKEFLDRWDEEHKETENDADRAFRRRCVEQYEIVMRKKKMMEEEKEVYFKFPDPLVLESTNKDHPVTGPSEFTLTMKGTIFDYVESSGKIFWVLEPNVEDFRFTLQPIKNAIVE